MESLSEREREEHCREREREERKRVGVRIHLPKFKIVWGVGNTTVLPTHPMIMMVSFLSTLHAQRIQPLTKLQTLNFFFFILSNEDVSHIKNNNKLIN